MHDNSEINKDSGLETFLNSCEVYEGEAALSEYVNILSPDNFTFLHGTSLKSAVSIMEQGLKISTTTTVSPSPILEGQDPDRRATILSSYTWKDTPRNQAVAVIAVIPFMKLLNEGMGKDRDEISGYMNEVRTAGGEETLLHNFSRLTKYDLQKPDGTSQGLKAPTIPFMEFTLPPFFIKGVNQIKNVEKYGYPIDFTKLDPADIVFYENPGYFDNLSESQQAEIIEILKKVLT